MAASLGGACRVLGHSIVASLADDAPSEHADRQQYDCTRPIAGGGGRRCYVNDRQDDWDVYLPTIKYVCNDSEQCSTGATPFVPDTGGHRANPLTRAIAAESVHVPARVTHKRWRARPQDGTWTLRSDCARQRTGGVAGGV
jgi:hypothetical protein